MKKLFTPEFKQQCLNLLLNERHTTIEVSKMMNVSISALQRWKVQYYKEKHLLLISFPKSVADSFAYVTYFRKVYSPVQIL